MRSRLANPRFSLSFVIPEKLNTYQFGDQAEDESFFFFFFFPLLFFRLLLSPSLRLIFFFLFSEEELTLLSDMGYKMAPLVSERDPAMLHFQCVCVCVCVYEASSRIFFFGL